MPETVIKWHGGKAYLAKRIVALMPPRCKTPNKPAPDDPGWLHYVEPYFGGGAVLFENDPEGISEVINDLNRDLVGFWRTLQSPELFKNFIRQVAAVPFSEQEFREAILRGGNAWEQWPVQSAAGFFICCRQSLAGRMKGFAGITRNRTRRGMNEQVSAWLNAIEGLPAVHARLKRVLILNRPALEVIRKEDGPRSLFYCDPPYTLGSRVTNGEYAHEMTEADHERLLHTLAAPCFEGRFMLSGYHSDIYDKIAAMNGWRCHEFDLPNNAAGGKEKRRMVECVWTNF